MAALGRQGLGRRSLAFVSGGCRSSAKRGSAATATVSGAASSVSTILMPRRLAGAASPRPDI